MRTFSLVFIIAVLFLGCGPQQFLTESEYKSIPKNATKIIAESPQPINFYYKTIINALMINGHRISASDKENFYINTDEFDCGSDTFLRLNINIIEDDSGVSTAIVSPQWKYGSSTQISMSAWTGISVPGTWENASPGKLGKSNLAFTNALRLCQTFSYDISFK